MWFVYREVHLLACVVLLYVGVLFVVGEFFSRVVSGRMEKVLLLLPACWLLLAVHGRALLPSDRQLGSWQ